MPTNADSGTTKPLNVRLSAQQHWAFKMGAAERGRDMAGIVSALLTVYTEDPAATDDLIQSCEARGVTLGEFVHELLYRSLNRRAAGNDRPGP